MGHRFGAHARLALGARRAKRAALLPCPCPCPCPCPFGALAGLGRLPPAAPLAGLRRAQREPHRLLDLPEHRLDNALPSPVDLLALRPGHLGPHLLLGRVGGLGGTWRHGRPALPLSGVVGVHLLLVAPHGIRRRPESSIGTDFLGKRTGGRPHAFDADSMRASRTSRRWISAGMSVSATPSPKRASSTSSCCSPRASKASISALNRFSSSTMRP